MTRLKRLAIAMAAAATVAFGSLTLVPTASALPMLSCTSTRVLARAYRVTGDAFLSIGAYVAAAVWYAKADGLEDGPCYISL
jgi:hypothetical protein